MPAERLDTIREGVLAQMERAERNVRLGILGAALVELALFAVALVMVDLHNRVERLVFVMSVFGYTIVALGLVALGAHVTRTVGRVIAAIDALERIG
jgi:hypothetical protein